MTRALAFLTPGRLDYGARLSRLRWVRAAGAEAVFEAAADSPANALLGRAATWVIVADPSAIPAGPVPQPPARGVAAGRAAGFQPGRVAHTLRELESAALAEPGGPALAVAFAAADFRFENAVTVQEAFMKLQDAAGPVFPVFAPGDPSESERAGVTARLPKGPLRILDAGCGSGGLALARERNPGWEVLGVERDPLLAARARSRGVPVVEGDLREVLPRLAASGERFDAVVFADVLEHLEEPVAALAAARGLAAPGGRLVVSVPNVGHVSVARDLLAGRFDPVPAGLCDAGHLRWFTRASLAEAIDEAGWELESLEGEPGAAASDTAAFEALLGGRPDGEVDRESLATYQWIATARAR